MRNVMVLGSGRSGTSMVAGTMAQAGWFVGAKPYPARSSNPKGFFESPDVNGINEYLLVHAAPAEARLGEWQHWLTRLPEDVECQSTPHIVERITRLTRHEPWCFKDPRLCYTLPVWRSVVPDPALVCIFRDPAETARSILKECRQEPYLAGVDLDFDSALDVWRRMYRRVLDVHRASGDWLFLHYEQVLSPSGLDALEHFVGGPLARGFPESGLRRSRCEDALPDDVAETYAELCRVAGFSTSPRERRAGLDTTLSRGDDLVQRAMRSMQGVSGSASVAQWLERMSAGERGSVARRRWSLQELETARDECLNYIDSRWPKRAFWERALSELAHIDIVLLESVELVDIERLAQAHIAAILRELAQLAIREERLRDIDAVLSTRPAAQRRSPWPIATNAARRWLAWPVWRVDELSVLLKRFVAHRGDALDCALCLRFDPAFDGDKDAAVEALRKAYQLTIPADTPVDVILLDENIARTELSRLGQSIDGWIELDSSRDQPRASWHAALGAPKLSTAVSGEAH